MNGLPPDVDLSPLSQAEFIDVRFSAFQLQLHFTNECRVMIEGTIIIRREHEETRVENYGQHGSLITQLPGVRLFTALRFSVTGGSPERRRPSMLRAGSLQRAGSLGILRMSL